MSHTLILGSWGQRSVLIASLGPCHSGLWVCSFSLSSGKLSIGGIKVHRDAEGACVLPGVRS